MRPEYTEYVKSQAGFFFNGNPGKHASQDKSIADPVKYEEVYQYRHAPPRLLGLEKLENLETVSDDVILEDDQFPSSDVVSQAVCTNSKSV